MDTSLKHINQTELGEIFGYSSIAMGEILCRFNLKNANEKTATSYALENNFAYNSSSQFLNQEPIAQARWNQNAIDYIKNKTKDDIEFITEGIIGHLKKLKKLDNDYNGQKYKIIYQHFSNKFSLIHNNREALILLSEKLENYKLIKYASQYAEIKNLPVFLSKLDLEESLQEKPSKEKKNKI